VTSTAKLLKVPDVKDHDHQIHNDDPLFSSEFDDAQSSDDSEDPQEYRRGGYHWVRVGDVYNDRYLIHRKLGWGQFSTVWLATDLSVAYDSPNKVVALKIMKSAAEYIEAAQDEMDLLRVIAKAEDGPGKRNIVQMLDTFDLYGPHGTHLCISLELMGRSLLSYLRSTDKGLPLKTVKRLSYQMAMGIHYLHTVCHIVHTDIKPENFLLTRRHPADAKALEKATLKHLETLKGKRVRYDKRPSVTSLKPRLNVEKKGEDRSIAGSSTTDEKSRSASAEDLILGSGGMPLRLPSLEKQTSTSTVKSTLTVNCEEAEIKICDFGNSCIEDQMYSRVISTRQYRSPEVILGCDICAKTDMWSLGCLIYELLTGDYLFDPEHEETSRVPRDESHLQLMMESLGEIPQSMLDEGKSTNEFFDKGGQLRHTKVNGFWGIELMLHRRYGMEENDAKASAEVLHGLLKYNPRERWSAANLIKSEWLQQLHCATTCQWGGISTIHDEANDFGSKA